RTRTNDDDIVEHVARSTAFQAQFVVQDALGVEHGQLIVAADDLVVDENLRRSAATGAGRHGVPRGRATADKDLLDCDSFAFEQSLCPVTPGSLWLGIHHNVCWHGSSPPVSMTSSVGTLYCCTLFFTSDLWVHPWSSTSIDASL